MLSALCPITNRFIPTSTFRFPPSQYRLPHSHFRLPSSLFMLVDMNVPLRERNADALGIKLLFDTFNGIEVNRPVVGSRGPDAHREVDAAVGQVGNDDGRLRFSHNTLILIDDLLDDPAGLVDIIPIADTEHKIHAAGSFDVEIRNIVPR